MSGKTNNPINILHLLFAFFLIGAIWQIASMVLSKPLLPAPYRVCQTWCTLMTTGVLWPHIASSLYRMGCGLALALITAIPIGMAAGRSRHWDALLSPFLYIFYSIPKVVFLPVIIVVLGLGDFPKIFMIAITVFFQIAIMVRDTARAIPEEQVMTMRSLFGTK